MQSVTNIYPHLLLQIPPEFNQEQVIQQIFEGKLFPAVFQFANRVGALYANSVIDQIIDEELRHDVVIIASATNSGLASMSSGERKKALLAHILAQKPAFMVVDNVFENLDITARASILATLQAIAAHTQIIQVLHRRSDVLPFLEQACSMVDKNTIVQLPIAHFRQQETIEKVAVCPIPPPLQQFPMYNAVPLVQLVDVSVSYNGRPILQQINWQVHAGEFWHLIGANGSGKSTILSMITGDNPKAFGQNLFLFGRKKGTGETVWELKQKIGYFSPTIAHQFDRLDSVEQMLIGGFFDSVGLYIVPSERQIQLAQQWLQLLNLMHVKNKSFKSLSLGLQRLVLVARAMVKHPPLLILDEPTSGLDDANAALLVGLINKIALESKTAIIYVSHQSEPNLTPQKVYQLMPTPQGSVGRVL